MPRLFEVVRVKPELKSALSIEMDVARLERINRYNSAIANLGKPSLSPKAATRLNAVVVETVTEQPELRPALLRTIAKRRYQAMLQREVASHRGRKTS